MVIRCVLRGSSRGGGKGNTRNALIGERIEMDHRISIINVRSAQELFLVQVFLPLLALFSIFLLHSFGIFRRHRVRFMRVAFGCGDEWSRRSAAGERLPVRSL